MQEGDLIARGERITKISVITLASFGVLLLFIGFLSGSVALRGSGIDTLGDAFTSLMVLVGLRMLQKPADERFQYGYYKIESFASMIVSIILVLTGFWILYISYISFISPVELGYPLPSLIISLISSATFFVLAFYKRKIASLLNSLALKTDSNNSLFSGLSSSVVFFGLVFSYIGIYHADAIAGMIIVILTFLAAYTAIRESSLILLDACACGSAGNIKEIAKSVKGVKSVHEVLLRKSGPYIFGEMHIKLDGKLSVYEAHKIVEKVEKLVRKKVPVLKRLTIKVEPVKKKF